MFKMIFLSSLNFFIRLWEIEVHIISTTFDYIVSFVEYFADSLRAVVLAALVMVQRGCKQRG